MALDFTMLSKCSPGDGQPFPKEKVGVPKRGRISFKSGGRTFHSAIKASCKAARLYSGMASKHWKRSDITVHPFVPFKGSLVLVGKSLLRSFVRVAEMVCELNLQKKLCVRCVVRTAFSLDWTGILGSPDRFKTHRVSHARQYLYSTR